MPVPEFDRRRLLIGAAAVGVSLVLPGCRAESPTPEAHEKELPSKNFLIVSRADGYDGAHEINPRVEALDPHTGELLSTLAHGSTTVRIAPGGRYVGLLTAEDDSYKGNTGPMPTTLRVVDTKTSLHQAIIQRTFDPVRDGIQLNRRSVAVDDTGCVALPTFYEDGVMLLVPDGTVAGTEVKKAQPTIAAAADPKPAFIQDTGELVIAQDQQAGFTVYICDGQTFESTATISVEGGSRSILSMDWKGDTGAIGTLNEQNGVYETILVSRSKGVSTGGLPAYYAPSFSSEGLLATSLTAPGSIEVARTGLAVINMHAFTEQRIDGLSDPQWLNANVLLARDIGSGVVHKVTLDEQRELGVPEALSYAIPLQEGTVIRGLA